MNSGIDDLDRALVHALQIDGRAPFRRIADVLGVSDQTIARRYHRLRESYGLRVLALTNPTAVHDRQWLLRVRAAPEAATKIADALARRTDTSWISLCSGGTEIVASAYGNGVEALLLQALPRTRSVLDVHAHEVLHVFYGGAGKPYTKQGPLRDEQISRLAQHVPRPGGPPTDVDDTGRRLLDVLRHDGRATIEQLTAATAAAPATVRRRLHELQAAGTLHLDVDINLDVFNLPVRTMMWLTVDMNTITEAGTTLSAHPETAFVAATTGHSNLFASVSTPDPTALYHYLTTIVAALPGLKDVETAPTLRPVKAAETTFQASPPRPLKPTRTRGVNR